MNNSFVRNQKENKKAYFRLILPYIILFAGILAMLVSSTFAWFSISENPNVNEMALYVNAPVGLEISTQYDAPDEQWGQNIAFTDLISETSPLKPVTWVDSERCFKSIKYGIDGRQTRSWKTLSDEKNANTTGAEQYYVYGTIYVRTDTPCLLKLAEAEELNGGSYGAGTYVIGQPVWNQDRVAHDDAGYGAQYAVRIGFDIAKIDAMTGEQIGESEFLIYEPNADGHLSGTGNYYSTPSIEGEDALCSPERLIVQSTSSWIESDPVQSGSTIKQLGKFQTPTDICKIGLEEKLKITIYIWNEGQDTDSYGVKQEGKLLANIQFKADYTDQSGLVDIPEG